MICKKCGKEIQDGVAFCSSCGAKIDEVAVNAPNVVPALEKPKNKHKGLIIFCSIVGALLILVILINAFDSESDSNNSSNNGISSSSDTKQFFKDTFGDTEENVIKTLAVSEIQEYPGEKHDEDVFDVEILAKDGYYNYIVGANTEYSSGMDKWWRVLIKLDTETGKMTTYVKTNNYRPDEERVARDDWENKFKTESEYGWGTVNHIK